MVRMHPLLLLATIFSLSLMVQNRLMYRAREMGDSSNNEILLEFATLNESHHRDPHIYIHPSPTDSRSPCPALNALANHGYLPRNGRKLSMARIAHAIESVYGLSSPFAYSVTLGGVGLLRQFDLISLSDLARHNLIEHDASLVHRDISKGKEYAPTDVDNALLAALLNNATQDHGQRYLDVPSLAAARVRRETESATSGKFLDNLHMAIACGEAALVLNVFGDDHFRIPVGFIADWWREERLPSNWAPLRKSTFLGTSILSTKINRVMNSIRDRESFAASNKSLSISQNATIGTALNYYNTV